MSDEISPLHTDLAIELSKIVHDKCENVPHDIGIELAQIALNASNIKLIFLDIDGVLNYELFYREKHSLNDTRKLGIHYVTYLQMR